MADTVSTVKVNIFKNGDHVSGTAGIPITTGDRTTIALPKLTLPEVSRLCTPAFLLFQAASLWILTPR